ncbi:MAG: hypothetical protein ACC661_05380 [Verrucomicrobiales bacterium]
MKYEEALRLLGGHGFFDLASLVQLTDERRETVQTQLYRWCRKGKLIPLRRGMYAFAEPYISQPINPAELANHLYRPSYLSTYWALGYYGLIPERVVIHTSISSRVTRRFENAFGVFTYRHVKAAAFFGYRPVQIDRQSVLLAEPEKALLDLWYLESGDWTMDRLREMRFDHLELVDFARLQEYAKRFASRRIIDITNRWPLLRGAEDEGTIQL